MNRLQRICYLWENIRELLDAGPVSKDNAFFIGDQLGQLIFLNAGDIAQNGLDMVRTRLVTRGEFDALEVTVSRYVEHIQAADDWQMHRTEVKKVG